MLIWLAILLPLFSYLLRTFRKRKIARFMLVLSPVLLYFGSTQIPVSYLIDKTEAHLQINEPDFGLNNMVVILTGGHVPDKQNNLLPHITADSRTLEALKLLNKCRAVATRSCKLLISGGDPQNYGQSEARTTLNKLISIGADTSNIILEELSRNTEESTLMSAQFINNEKSDKVFVVTSGYHTKRAQLWFEHNGVTPVMVPSDHLQAGGPWWLPRPFNLLYAEVCLRELAGIVWMKIKTFSL